VALDPQLESSEGKLLGDALEAFRTIVVPLDGTPGAERVLPYAELLARASAGEIVLLRVTPRPAAPLTPIGQPVPGGGIDLSAAVDDERLKASADLETVRRRLVSRDFRVTTVVVTGSPDQEIVRRARALDADLIAMTTRARGGLQRVVYGSVADAVVQQATCPVFLLPVRDGGRAGVSLWGLGR
jgi:nucleotide-binding universal stress UspA family protein